MNNRMEREIEKTIHLLQSYMSGPEDRQTSLFTLLRIAISEMEPSFLLALFLCAIVFGVISTKLLSMPMLTTFCTAPVPVLLLFHRYILDGNVGMRELEGTFQYSYAEMLIGRSTIISWYMFLTLFALSFALHRSTGESLLRLVLCGIVPSLYLCVILLFLSGVIHNQEGLSLIAITLWIGLCFLALLLPFHTLLQICSTGIYTILTIIGLCLYGACTYKIKSRRDLYVVNM